MVQWGKAMSENFSPRQWSTIGLLVAGSVIAAGIVLPSFGSRNADLNCDKTIGSQPLTETQIMKLLTFKKGIPKNDVRSLIKAPYCTLSAVKVRAGTQTDREAYLVQSDDFLQVDPKTKLVILYEGNQYTGYRFWVH
jgi:hypothetical protein